MEFALGEVDASLVDQRKAGMNPRKAAGFKRPRNSRATRGAATQDCRSCRAVRLVCVSFVQYMLLFPHTN